MNVDNNDAQYLLMDLRMRRMEINMLKHVSVFTLCTAQMSMQMQNQNAILDNLYTQQISNRNSHAYTAPSYMPLFHHSTFYPQIPHPMPHLIPQAPHFMYTRPPTAFPPPGMQPNPAKQMIFSEPNQTLGQPMSMQQHVKTHPL